MAHSEQTFFCITVKTLLPKHFQSKKVLDVGSLDINGNNRHLFEGGSYTGLDVGQGENVDIVCKTHEFNDPDGSYQTIISTECFEHDMFYDKSLLNIVRLLASGGLFIFTCASTGRPEHGTARTSPADAPLLSAYENWSDYYKNLTEEDIRAVIDVDDIFKKYKFEYNPQSFDLYFYGVKR